MYYNLPAGTKITFPDTPDNREILLGPDHEEDYAYTGFALEKTYEIGGLDDRGKCFFWDGAGIGIMVVWLRTAQVAYSILWRHYDKLDGTCRVGIGRRPSTRGYYDERIQRGHPRYPIGV